MIDTRALLDQLLTGGADLARRGEDAAARQMGVGDDPAARGDFRKGAMGGAAAAGALALLLGTKTGRSIGSAGALAGGLGLIAKLAHDAWTKRQEAAELPAPAPAAALPSPVEDARARVLIAALIAAARSDGHVDASELATIRARLASMGPEAEALLVDELSRPLDAAALAARVPDPQTAREVYTLTAAVCDPTDPPERAWMDRLGQALGLDPALTGEIERGLRAG